jgi:hypothetical protein
VPGSGREPLGQDQLHDLLRRPELRIDVGAEMRLDPHHAVGGGVGHDLADQSQQIVQPTLGRGERRLKDLLELGEASERAWVRRVQSGICGEFAQRSLAHRPEKVQVELRLGQRSQVTVMARPLSRFAFPHHVTVSKRGGSSLR